MLCGKHGWDFEAQLLDTHLIWWLFVCVHKTFDMKLLEYTPFDQLEVPRSFLLYTRTSAGGGQAEQHEWQWQQHRTTNSCEVRIQGRSCEAYQQRGAYYML